MRDERRDSILDRTSRRRLLGAIVAIPAVGLGTQLRRVVGGESRPRYVRDVQFEQRALDVDDDGTTERQIRVSFVPKRRLLSVRLEHPVRQAIDPGEASELDDGDDQDGWYPLSTLTPVDTVGERVYLRNELRQADPNEAWLVQATGFQSTDVAQRDYTGFRYGDRLRLVVTPYGEDPIPVREHRLS